MGTVIDELVVQLKLDPKQFDDAQKATVGKLRQFERDHERHSKKLSKDTDGLTQSFAALQGRLLGIASLFMGGMGIQQFTEHITRMTVQTGYLAASLGLSTSELAKWQGVGATVNATSGEMAQTIKSVQEAFADMRMGRPSKLLTFSRITHNGAFAGAPVDVDPFNPDPTKFMTDVSRWYVAQKDRAVATKIIQDNLGFNQGTMNALALGPEELQKRLKEMEKYGPTKEEVKNFQDLQEALSKAAIKAEALGRAILSFLTPGIVKFLGTLSGIADTFRDKGASEGAKAIDDAASGGVGEAFGTVKGWGRSLWNRGKRALGLGGDAGGNTNTEPGQTGGGVPSSSTPNVGPGSSAFLRGRRKKFADAINANPGLRREIAGMMILEGAKHPVPVAESLFNRADYAGGTLHSHLHNGFYGPINRGGLPRAMARYDHSPALRARMDAAIDRALAGSNIIEGYTDQGLPTDPNGSLTQTRRQGYSRPFMKIGGNEFLDWNGGPGGHRAAARYRHMIMEGVARERSERSASGSISLGRTPSAHPSDILLDGGATPPPFSFGAGAAMQRGAPVTNNNRTSSTNIQSMNVTVPQGSDPDAYARGIIQRLAHYNNVQSANQGLV